MYHLYIVDIPYTISGHENPQKDSCPQLLINWEQFPWILFCPSTSGTFFFVGQWFHRQPRLPPIVRHNKKNEMLKNPENLWFTSPKKLKAVILAKSTRKVNAELGGLWCCAKIRATTARKLACLICPEKGPFQSEITSEPSSNHPFSGAIC